MALVYSSVLVVCITIGVLQFVAAVPYSSTPLSFAQSLGPQDPRIINGTEASVHNTKHQASIRRRLNDGYFFGTGHICGGSLISENVVLCAAHCFIDQVAYNGSFLPDKDFIVVMGNLDRFERNNNTLIFDIRKVVKYHDVFNPQTYDQDLVLVMLNASVPANHPTVQPIALNASPLKAQTMCQVTGWGVTEQGYSSDFLMTLDVPIISFNACRQQTAYGTAIHRGMLCAGYLEGERDACQGDSGGPLVCDGVQAGIISWGIKCALPKQPGVYTDIAYYAIWILTKTVENNGTMPQFIYNDTNDDDDIGGGNGTTGNGTDVCKCDSAMTAYNDSFVLVAFMLVFNTVLSKF